MSRGWRPQPPAPPPPSAKHPSPPAPIPPPPSPAAAPPLARLPVRHDNVGAMLSFQQQPGARVVIGRWGGVVGLGGGSWRNYQTGVRYSAHVKKQSDRQGISSALAQPMRFDHKVTGVSRRDDRS